MVHTITHVYTQPLQTEDVMVKGYYIAVNLKNVCFASDGIGHFLPMNKLQKGDKS